MSTFPASSDFPRNVTPESISHDAIASSTNNRGTERVDNASTTLFNSIERENETASSRSSTTRDSESSTSTSTRSDNSTRNSSRTSDSTRTTDELRSSTPIVGSFIRPDEVDLVSTSSEVMDLLSHSIGQLEQAASTLQSLNPRSFNQTWSEPSNRARGLDIAQSTPAGLRSPAFVSTPFTNPLAASFGWEPPAASTFTPVAPLVLTDANDIAPVLGLDSSAFNGSSLTQALADAYGEPLTDTLMVGGTPVTAGYYVPEGSDNTDLASVMQQDPIIILI